MSTAAPETEVEIDEFTGQPKRAPRDETAPTEPAPIVEISTVIEREFITIDSKRYDLASWHDFGVVKRQELQSQSVEFNRLWATATLDEAQKERLAQLLLILFKEAVPKLPAAVAKKLDDANRESLVVAFTLAPVREATRPARTQLQKDAQARNDSTTAS